MKDRLMIEEGITRELITLILVMSDASEDFSLIKISFDRFWLFHH